MIDCSIIIVNWNTKMLLMQCINSLIQKSKGKSQNQKSKVKSGYEIIVVDNGSTDDSVKMFENLKIEIENSLNLPAGKAGIKNCELKIIKNENNLGFAKAVNQGIQQAQGETILLLNSDTRITPNALDNLLKFEKKVKPAIIGAKMLNNDGSVQGSCFFFPTINRAISEFWLKRGNYFSKYVPQEQNPMEVEAVSGGAMLISKEIIDKIGVLDERYFMYFEDLDYCRRAKKHGIKVYYLPSAEVIHEHGASGKHLADSENQWKRMIPSSKIYHGFLKYYVISLIIRTGQKIWKK